MTQDDQPALRAAPAAATLAPAPRLLFGWGRLAELGPLAAEHGRRALVITNADRQGRLGLRRHVLALLATAGVGASERLLAGEPTLDDVAGCVAQARESRADLLIGLGGGSALDAAKACAALLTNGGEALDYLEVIGAGRPLTRPAAPCLAVPTTAGTGAEATRNAVLGCPARGVKASLRSHRLVPAAALIDPSLGVAVRPAVVAAAGMDALVQLIEAYTHPAASPYTDALALAGLRAAVPALPLVAAAAQTRARGRQGAAQPDSQRARSSRRPGGPARCRQGAAQPDSQQQAFTAAPVPPAERAAREALAWAAYFSGLCLTNAGLGAVHGFAAAIGARHGVAHGALCAALLAPVLAANIASLRRPGSPMLSRYAQIGRLLAGDSGLDQPAALEAAPREAATLAAALDIQPLAAYGLGDGDVEPIVTAAQAASSMRGNPVALPAATLAAILREAIGGQAKNDQYH